MHPSPLLSILNLQFAYEASRPIIKDCSFSLSGGDHVGIIGPNGSGKSTLFKLLIRLLKPQRGEILLHCRPLNSYSQKDIARHIAFVPQEFDPLFPLCVWEVVMMGRSPHLGYFALDKSDDRTIVEEAMRFTEVIDFSNRPITELSGGERQRVLFARAIAQDTPLLLLDEPANHLDLKYQWKMMDWIDELIAEKKKTVLSVLHHLDHAERCTEMILWKQGRPYLHGTPSELLDKQKLMSLFT